MSTLTTDPKLPTDVAVKLATTRGEFADRLAEAISALLDVPIGEHTRTNNPWQNALDAATAHMTALKPAERPAAASVVPAEGSGQRCPSRIAHESGAIHRCDLSSGHDGMHEVRVTRFFADDSAEGSGHPQPAPALPWPFGADPVAEAHLRANGMDPEVTAHILRDHIRDLTASPRRPVLSLDTPEGATDEH